MHISKEVIKMIVEKTSIFPASRDTVLEELKKLETLQYIARPYATFEPVINTGNVWKVGVTSSYRFKLFGFIPFGTHHIHIIRMGNSGISSMEGNEHVRVWNHDIYLTALDDTHTKYTDKVTIRAGWKTPFIWLWASAFYAHRQRKWITLLERHKEQSNG